MDLKIIFGSDVTIENLLNLNRSGFEFVIEDGVITEVVC